MTIELTFSTTHSPTHNPGQDGRLTTDARATDIDATHANDP